MLRRALLRCAEHAFWFAGTLLCVLAAGVYLQAHFYQKMQESRLEAALRSVGPRGLPDRPRSSPPPASGSLVGRLEIPRLKLSAIVLEGSDSRVFRLGVGRVPQSADPGQVGNLVLGGHRDTFFRPLHAIRSGDRVKLVTPHGAYRYVVAWTAVVDPQDADVLKATADRSLTLVTCYPFHYVGPAPQRFIVRAHQVAGAGRAASD